MPDYGHDLLFGVALPSSVAGKDAPVELAIKAEQVGLDLASVMDHPYNPSLLEAWTLLATIAARTERLRLFPNVANLPLRPPAVLARAVASLDLLSDGRLELGLGAGWLKDEIASFDGPRHSVGQGIDALAEAIGVIRSLWTPGTRTDVDGRYYRVIGGKPLPPAHEIGIWVGAYKPRMLALTGRLADGWVPSAGLAPPSDMVGMSTAVDEAAIEAGRDPADIRRLYNVNGSFTGSGNGFLQGPPHVWVEQLTELALGLGISGFMLLPRDNPSSELKRFAVEIAPAVREAVAAERQGDTVPHEDLRSPDGSRARAVGAHRSHDDAGVKPTLDDGVRLTDTGLLDEASRPRLAEGIRVASTVRGEASRAELKRVHDHFRQQLSQLRDAVDEVARGGQGISRARSALSGLAQRQNHWTLGAFCASYCRAMTGHHIHEDEDTFVKLQGR